MLVRKTWLLACPLIFFAAPAMGGQTPDPLGLVPEQAELVFKVERPAKLAETIYHLDVVQELKKIQALRELYESTKVRRLQQLLNYVESKLGYKRFDLLDRLAGGGIVLAVKFSGKAPAVLVVMQARDEELLKKFAKLSLEVIEQELARQEKKPPIKSTYRDIETIQIDKGHFAILGSALVLASDRKVLERTIDGFREGGQKSVAGVGSLAVARKKLVPDPYAWVWLNLEALRAIPGFKEGINAVVLQPVFYATVGPLFEVVGRSPYLSGGLYQQGKDFSLTVRMGAGRKGMSEKAALFLPAKGQGSLPLLEPANVQASFSYFLDLSKMWEHKDKWLGEKERKELEKLEEKSGFFLGGVKLGTLLKQAGVHFRFVVTTPTKSVYQVVQGQQVGSFGLALDMRDPAFGKSLETILRGVGVFTSLKFNLKMVEEKRGPYKLVSYRFAEDGKLPGDNNNIRFNFSPCFARVGNQFIASSTVELGQELIDLVAAEKKPAPDPASSRFRIYARGIAANLKTTEDQIRNQYILGQALNPREAQEQIRLLIDLVNRLGVIQAEIHYGNDDFRYEIRWQRDNPKKGSDPFGRRTAR